MKTALYRYYADDELLYIGISSRLPRRVREHARDPWWEQTSRIDVEWHPTREAALAAERNGIRAEQPYHNIKNRRTSEAPQSPFPLRVRVEDALAAQGLDLDSVLLTARQDGQSIESVWVNLRALTPGIRFCVTTLYRWVDKLEVPTS